MSSVTETNELNKAGKHRSPEGIRGLIAAIIFVAVFIVGITSLTYMIRGSGDTKNRFMGFYAEPKDSLDVILIGSSPTYSSCVTPELYGEYGIKAYPLASNVQRPVAGMYLVKEAEKTQTPKLYMFEMRMYVGIEEGLVENMAYTREVTDNMKYSFNRIDTIRAMTGGLAKEYGYIDEPYTYYFDIFKYHSNWKSLVNPGQWASWRYTRLDPSKGYKITDKVGPVDTPVINENVEAAPLDKYQEQALQDLLKYLKDNNLNALFYVSPYKLAEGDDAKLAHIQETVEAAGFDWLDMNQNYDEIGIDFARDFSDYGIHTNAVGAKKCTQFLGDYLKEHYDLPDHRNDEKTKTKTAILKANKTWDEAYDNWLAEYDDALIKIDERIENEDFFVMEE